MKYFFICFFTFVQLVVFSQTNNSSIDSFFNQEIAEKLAQLPLKCITNEWPNKTSHTSDSSTDHTLLPHELHPAFFGCLDWHSSVHGHWMLIKLLKQYPNLKNKQQILSVLNNSFQTEKIIQEAAYFSKYKTSNTYERTYGWAWLLKLDEELYTWKDSTAQLWYKTLQPLTQKVVALWKNYLPKQTYPNRTGVHPNTAFALAFALDWARALSDTSFENIIVKRSKDYYLNNTQTPANLEPDGSDFFSPSLEIADLMRRVLPIKSYAVWFHHFYTKQGLVNIIIPPIVSDRSDYQIVHLDGLSLSRAWCMKGIAKALPKNNLQKKIFENTAQQFLKNTLPNVTSGNYGGDHWLASFAVYAILQ